jgi:cyclohexanone monooxygenase
VLPKPDATVPAPMQRVLRAFPRARAALRGAEYAAMEAFGLGFRHPWIMEQVQRIGEAHLRRSVTDPTLRKKLTPDYTLGCKRLLMSNTYYPALTRPNVEVHAAAVTRIDGPRVHASDGTTAEIDVIVYGTGFRILDMPIAHHLRDADGATLASRWKGSPRAYLGTTVAGFPNLFVLLGPSLGTGHSSAFTILEAQLGYVVSALRAMRRGGLSTIEVRREVQRAVRRTVYVQGGCGSYYLDENGKNTFSWPWSTPALEARLARFDLDDYRTERETTVAAHATGSYA